MYERFRDGGPGRKRSDEVELTTRWTSMDSKGLLVSGDGWEGADPKPAGRFESDANRRRTRAAFLAIAAVALLILILLLTMNTGGGGPSATPTPSDLSDITEADVDSEQASDYTVHEETIPPHKKEDSQFVTDNQSSDTGDEGSTLALAPSRAPEPPPFVPPGLAPIGHPSMGPVEAPSVAHGPAPGPEDTSSSHPGMHGGDDDDDNDDDDDDDDGDHEGHKLICTAQGSTPSVLDSHLLPRSYNLTLSLGSHHFAPGTHSSAPSTFDAEVSIMFDVEHTTPCLVLHSKDLQYEGVWLRRSEDDHTHCICGPGGKCHKDSCDDVIVRSADSEMVIVHFGHDVLLANQTAEVRLKYSGKLGAGQGLYRSAPFFYTAREGSSDSNKTGVLIVTQLEATGARQLFPGYDQPQYKAQFAVNLEVPADKVALSNMPVQDKTQGANNTALYSFQTTPLMSTYLLAVTVGQLSSLDAGEAAGHELKLFSVPGKEHQLQQAAKVASAALEFYTNWTMTSQPMTKFDFVSVPGKQGAMENWGLLLFDEDRLLWNEDTEGQWGLWQVADVVCHELAHQWFGNYVTCADWDNLALNEGLASFMEYKCIQAVFDFMPERALRQLAATPLGEQPGVHEGPHALALRHASDPLTPPVIPPPGGQLDNVMVYSGAATILQMMEDFAESRQPGAMREGLTLLLKRYAYSTATIEDLMTCIADSIGSVDATTFASNVLPWFHNATFPLVSVAEHDDRDGVVLTQQPYYSWNVSGICQGNTLITQSINNSSTNDTLCEDKPPHEWWVPLGLGIFEGSAANGEIGENAVEYLEMENPTQDLTDHSSDTNGAFVVNKHGSGAFRVQYSASLLEELMAVMSGLAVDTAEGAVQLPSASMDTLLDASTLISDIFSLSLAGQLSPVIALRAAAAVSSAPAARTGAGSFLLLLPILEGLAQFHPVVSGVHNCLPTLSQFTAQLVQPAAEEMMKIIHQPVMTQNDFLGAMAMGQVLSVAARHGGNVSDTLCAMYGPHCVWCGAARDAAYAGMVGHAAGCDEASGQSDVEDEGGDAAWQSMVQCFMSEQDIAEAHRCLFSLAATQKAKLLKRTVELVLGASKGTKKVSLKDAAAIVRQVSLSPFKQNVAWLFLYYHWQDVVDTHELSGACHILDSIYISASHNRLEDVEKFITKGKGVQCPIAVKEGVIGRLQHSIQLAKQFAHDMCDYLKTQ